MLAWLLILLTLGGTSRNRDIRHSQNNWPVGKPACMSCRCWPCLEHTINNCCWFTAWLAWCAWVYLRWIKLATRVSPAEAAPEPWKPHRWWHATGDRAGNICATEPRPMSNLSAAHCWLKLSTGSAAEPFWTHESRSVVALDSAWGRVIACSCPTIGTLPLMII